MIKLVIFLQKLNKNYLFKISVKIKSLKIQKDIEYLWFLSIMKRKDLKESHNQNSSILAHFIFAHSALTPIKTLLKIHIMTS